MTPSPILPFLPLVHFHLNTAVTRPVNRLGLRAQTTCLGSGYKHKVAKCNFAPKTQKWVSMHLQWEYAWLSVWHIISQQSCETKWRFQKTTYRKPHIASSMVMWPMTLCDPKGQGHDPNIFQGQYLKNLARQMVGSSWLPRGNLILQVQWSRNWRLHMTPKC